MLPWDSLRIGKKSLYGVPFYRMTPEEVEELLEAIREVWFVTGGQAGRYGGTFACPDIAFEFTSWISVEFKLYLVKEFQRLKSEEQKQLG